MTLPTLIAFVTVAAHASQLSGKIRPDHSLFTEVLRTHVTSGAVNYRSLKTDERLTQYIEYIKQLDTSALHPDDRLPFWINAYNAWTLKVVADNYPVKSIMDLGAGFVIGTIFKTTVWDKPLVTMNNGMTMSLNDIEHKIVRKYNDARVHFALVCASKSCPPLRTEAYVAERLNEQLDDQGRVFLADTTKNRFELSNKRVFLSKIFDWFEGDFEKNSPTVLRFIARFLPEHVARQLLANEKGIRIEYLDYDWSLNE